LLAGTVQAGDHVDVVGTWEVKTGTGGDGTLVSRVVLRDLLVLTAPQGSSSSTVTSGSGGMSAQLRVTDAQAQKLIWIQKNGVDGGFHLALRPPSSSLDSSNTYQDSRLMLSDGPGRRP
jgi:Flp pilus assembly protein CpaB